MTKTNKTNKKTIGEMANGRIRWAFAPSTRIVKNKKGKGSYNRKKEQSYKGCSFFHIRLLLPGKHSSDVCNSFRKIEDNKNKKDDPVNSEVIFFNVLANAFHQALNLW
ncbi:ribosome alternative rescue factor ArfA [Peribacillus frigoritolerans]|uniref:ribosome alternative rescue factor ArfA n=1 Tax=Peribacillus frigoritolerans TaxID=450367 RepID=UPI002226FED9|nr:ribosome alternative rescue factor ArfA [Peribacillus frigoritolerans]UYY98427.1 ribosome alternative rescue factor ArfA [Peribacillus frigoritolerans]